MATLDQLKRADRRPKLLGVLRKALISGELFSHGLTESGLSPIIRVAGSTSAQRLIGRFDQRSRRRRIRLAAHEGDELLACGLQRANFLQDCVDRGWLRPRYPIGFGQSQLVNDAAISKIIRKYP